MWPASASSASDPLSGRPDDLGDEHDGDDPDDYEQSGPVRAPVGVIVGHDHFKGRPNHRRSERLGASWE